MSESAIFTNADRRLAMDAVDEVRVVQKVCPDSRGMYRLLTHPIRGMFGKKTFKGVFVTDSPQTNGDIDEDMRRTLKLNAACVFRPRWLYKMMLPLLKKRETVLMELAEFGDIQVEQIPTYDGSLYCYLAIATPMT